MQPDVMRKRVSECSRPGATKKISIKQCTMFASKRRKMANKQCSVCALIFFPFRHVAHSCLRYSFFFPFSCSRCSSVIFIATASPMSFAKSSLQSQLHIFIKTSSSLAPVAVVFMLSKHLFCFVDFVSYALRFSYTKRTHCKSRGT